MLTNPWGMFHIQITSGATTTTQKKPLEAAAPGQVQQKYKSATQGPCCEQHSVEGLSFPRRSETHPLSCQGMGDALKVTASAKRIPPCQELRKLLCPSKTVTADRGPHHQGGMQPQSKCTFPAQGPSPGRTGELLSSSFLSKQQLGLKVVLLFPQVAAN